MTPTRFIKIKALVLGAALVGAGVAHAEPGPWVYIPTGDSAKVLIIDTSTNGVIGEIEGFSAAHGLAVTPDGGRLIATGIVEIVSLTPPEPDHHVIEHLTQHLLLLFRKTKLPVPRRIFSLQGPSLLATVLGLMGYLL